MRYFYWLISLIILLAALFIFQLKGYLNVRNFWSNRDEVSKYLSQKYTFKSFFSLKKEEVSSLIKTQFTDIKSASIKKNPNLTIEVEVESRNPFAQVEGGGFISTEGVFYFSNISSQDNLPKFIAKDLVLMEPALSTSQVSFIQEITKNYPDFKGEIINPFHFILYVNDLEIESERNYDNISSLATVVLDILKQDSKVRPKKVLLLDSRVVVKK